MVRSPILQAVAAVLLFGCSEKEPPWEPATCSENAPEDSVIVDNEGPKGDLSPDTSATIVLGANVFLGAWLTLSCVACAIHGSLARRARAQASAAPVVGEWVTVSGVVESDGAKVPLELTIEQVRTSRYLRGVWSHRWNEVRRATKVRDFRIRRADGQCVQVMPGKRVELQGKSLDSCTLKRDKRARSIRIAAGDPVHVVGFCHSARQVRPGAARDASATLVIGPAAKLPMVISSLGVGEFDLARAGFHRRWSKFLAVLWTALNLLFLLRYHLLSLEGRPVSAWITAHRTSKTWMVPSRGSRGYWAEHYAFRANLLVDDRTYPVEEECRRALYERIRSSPCQPVRFVFADFGVPIYQLGTRPTISPNIGVGVFGLAFVLVIYPLTWMASRPWYRRRKLHEDAAGPS